MSFWRKIDHYTSSGCQFRLDSIAEYDRCLFHLEGAEQEEVLRRRGDESRKPVVRFETYQTALDKMLDGHVIDLCHVRYWKQLSVPIKAHTTHVLAKRCHFPYLFKLDSWSIDEEKCDPAP